MIIINNVYFLRQKNDSFSNIIQNFHGRRSCLRIESSFLFWPSTDVGALRLPWELHRFRMCLQSVLGTMVPNMAQSACVGEVSSYVGVITSSVMSSDHEFNLLRYLCQILSPHPPPLSVLVPFLNPSLTLSLSLSYGEPS